MTLIIDRGSRYCACLCTLWIVGCLNVYLFSLSPSLGSHVCRRVPIIKLQQTLILSLIRQNIIEYVKIASVCNSKPTSWITGVYMYEQINLLSGSEFNLIASLSLMDILRSYSNLSYIIICAQHYCSTNQQNLLYTHIKPSAFQMAISSIKLYVRKN